MSNQRFDKPGLRKLFLTLARRLGRCPGTRDLETANAMHPERFPSLATWYRYWSLGELKEEYRFINVNPSRVRRCLECDVRFVATQRRAKFCCRAHAYRHRDRKRTKQREEQGLCVKCGGEITEPSPTPELQKDPFAPTRYCSACRTFWRENKRRRRRSIDATH